MITYEHPPVVDEAKSLVLSGILKPTTPDAMLDSTQLRACVFYSPSPSFHAFRGASAAWLVLAALANVTDNRQALLALLRRRSTVGLQLVRPSRNGIALVVFIGWCAQLVGRVGLWLD